MNILIANEVTGEVVGTSVKDGIPQLRGVIRKWMNDGLKFRQFRILESSSIEVYAHIHDYALYQQRVTCDLCDKQVKYSNMEFVEDNDMCILGYCNHCAEEMTH